ncbi:MAG: hypothetical protein Q7U10_01365 [Thermodesulfovibrionia bacterium]|nr:hypothetical protein [Thermodesulfovibrionia bacterium]
MKLKNINIANKNILNVLMVCSIALITFLAYKDILSYFFTGLDSLNLIEEGRFQSLSDVLKLFFRPMTQEFAWYRPLAELSYGIDYFIWGLNPFGFQLMQLLLHISVSILVFFFARFLLNGKDDISAWLCALIFSLHPIHVEVIPVTARRNDMIITLFILPSLMLFMKYFTSGLRRRSYLLLSIFFYALALLTKELAVIVPVMIFSYVFIFSFTDNASFVKTFIYSLKRCIPYLAITVAYLLWRMHILSGMGGYASSFGESRGILTLTYSGFDIVFSYFQDLIYPVDFLRLDLLFDPFTTIFRQTVFVLALLVAFMGLCFYRKKVFDIMCCEENRIINNIKILLMTVMISSVISILMYPIISPSINSVIQQSYIGKGLEILSKAMSNVGSHTVETYFYKARDIILRPLLFLILFSVICLMGIHKRKKLLEFFICSEHGKLITFLVVWMLIPLGIYIATLTFDHHDMYVSVIPFSMIVSIVLCGSYRTVLQGIRKSRASSYSLKISFQNTNILKLIVIAAMAISLFLYSPLLKKYGEWEATGTISREILEKLSNIITELPDNAVIYLVDFPSGIASYKKLIPHSREVGYYAEFSIESWIVMTYPDRRIKVHINSKRELSDYPDDIKLQLDYISDNNVIINIIYNKEETHNL